MDSLWSLSVPTFGSISTNKQTILDGLSVHFWFFFLLRNCFGFDFHSMFWVTKTKIKFSKSSPPCLVPKIGTALFKLRAVQGFRFGLILTGSEIQRKTGSGSIEIWKSDPDPDQAKNRIRPDSYMKPWVRNRDVSSGNRDHHAWNRYQTA